MKRGISWLMILSILLSMPEMLVFAGDLRSMTVVKEQQSISGSDVQGIVEEEEEGSLEILQSGSDNVAGTGNAIGATYVDVEGLGTIPIEEMIPDHNGESYTMVLFDVNMSDKRI